VRGWLWPKELLCNKYQPLRFIKNPPYKVCLLLKASTLFFIDYFLLFAGYFCVYYICMLEKGLIQIYTGKGKGKTTAGFGLALRAAGHGAKVLIYQFLKPDSLELGERRACAHVDGITVKALSEKWDMFKSFNDERAAAKMRKAIRRALEEIEKYATEKAYDMIILDEIVFCLSKSLAEMEDIKRIIAKKDDCVEIVLTGRGASDELIELADLVTEMKTLKHPFEKGINARRGIEF